MKFATDIDCLITEALERIATNTRTAVVALDAIYTDCKEEYYLWDSTERPCGKGVTCLTYSQVTTPHPTAKMGPLTSELSVHERKNEISHNKSYYPYCGLTTSTSKLLQGPNVSNDNDNEESIVTSKERDNYCYDIPNAKQDPRDLTAFKYSSIESETNTSMGTMNGGDGSPCFHKSRQFPTNTKIEFHQAVICDLFPLVARGLVKEESNVGGAGVLDRGT